MHVYYGERVLNVRDGLPKYRDLPKEFGAPARLFPVLAGPPNKALQLTSRRWGQVW